MGKNGVISWDEVMSEDSTESEDIESLNSGESSLPVEEVPLPPAELAPHPLTPHSGIPTSSGTGLATHSGTGLFTPT